jgi:cobalt-zinc-cadmium efflux system protein
VDPIVAVLISLLLFVGAMRVLRQGAGILLQQSPHDTASLRDLVCTVDGVVDIDDFRLWQICSHMVIGTAHVITDVETLKETEEISNRIRSLLEERYQVQHLTLQFETREMWQRHSHDVRHVEQAETPSPDQSETD